MAVIATQTKVCTKCREELPLSAFHRRSVARGGLNPACKDCLRELRRLARRLTDEDRDVIETALRTRPTKLCGGCGLWRPRGAFRARPRVRDGLQSRCKDCESTYAKTYNEQNKEKRAAQAAIWQANNKDRRRAIHEAWYAANRDDRYQKSLAWRKANPERWAELHARHRARIKAATVGEVDVEALWTGVCGICDEEMDRALRRPDLLSKSLDHIIPLSKGGEHSQANLQYAHLICNIRKNDRLDYVAQKVS